MEHLATYNPIAQHYGTWLSGYDWSIYGCGTFRNPMNHRLALALGKRFFEKLQHRLHLPVSYAGVLEHRYSGLGLSPIPAHWHFVAGSSNDPQKMANAAQVLWQDLFGNAKIEPYDPLRDGAYYVAKLAAHENGNLAIRGLDRKDYQGSDDLLDTASKSFYVPKRLSDMVFGEYLVVRT